MGINLSFRQRCGKVSFGYEGFLTFLSRESENGMCPTTAECVIRMPFKCNVSQTFSFFKLMSTRDPLTIPVKHACIIGFLRPNSHYSWPVVTNSGPVYLIESGR